MSEPTNMTSQNRQQPHEWRTSSYSSYNGNCVEVGQTGSGVAIRHSKQPNGPVLFFSSEEWHLFLLGVRSGELD